MEAGWSTITKTLPNWAVSLSKTARSFGSLFRSGLSNTVFPAGVRPWPCVCLPTSKPRKMPTPSILITVPPGPAACRPQGRRLFSRIHVMQTCRPQRPGMPDGGRTPDQRLRWHPSGPVTHPPGAGGTHDFVSWLARRGRWLSYSVGMTVTEAIREHVLKVPASAWTAAVETSGEVRDGAWVAELTGKLLDGWPGGMRLIVRKERPHPGAQLRITDADGMRITCFATNTAGRPIAELELRHRLRARAEDRIRAARATGLRNLPLHTTAQNKVWLEIVQIALYLLAWMPMLALTGTARLWEPRRLRFRLFTAAGQLVTTGRRRILRLARHWPWTSHITAALDRLALLPNPG